MSECALGRCDGSGFLYDEASNTAYDCRCRAQMIARRTAKSLSAVIPRLYQEVSFDRAPITEIEPRATVEAARSFIARIDHHLDQGNGLCFVGGVGTGKTALAMLVSKSALKAGRTVAIYSVPRLLNVIRDSFTAERSHTELLDRLTAVDLLHLDDVGAERSSDWVLEELYSIINARYEEQRSIVMTTNLEDAQLRDQIHERSVSRLDEMCDRLPVQGDDRRGVWPEPQPAPERRRFDAPQTALHGDFGFRR